MAGITATATITDGIAGTITAGSTKARWLLDESPSRFSLLFAHDLFGKPLHTFPDHALIIGSDESLVAACRSSISESNLRFCDENFRARRPDRGRRAKRLLHRRRARRSRRREGRTCDQSHCAKIPQRRVDAGLASRRPRLLCLQSRAQEALRHDQAALRRAGALARSLRSGYGRG